MQTFTYRPQGVCSRQFEIGIEDGKVMSFSAIGGCSGNLQGIGLLIAGMPVDEVISRLEGVRCGCRSKAEGFRYAGRHSLAGISGAFDPLYG